MRLRLLQHLDVCIGLEKYRRDDVDVSGSSLNPNRSYYCSNSDSSYHNSRLRTGHYGVASSACSWVSSSAYLYPDRFLTHPNRNCHLNPCASWLSSSDAVVYDQTRHHQNRPTWLLPLSFAPLRADWPCLFTPISAVPALVVSIARTTIIIWVRCFTRDW